MEFRLLIPSSFDGEHSSQPTLFLAGSHWILSPSLPLPSKDDNPTGHSSEGSHEDRVPPFACISYRWARSRSPHPFVERQTISSHTRPALATAMRGSKRAAFWTDALCIPPSGIGHDAARQRALETMGYLYALAAEVIVVLSPQARAVLEAMNGHKKGLILEEELRVLEMDEWISSVWTYQEVVNARTVYFVAEQSESNMNDERSNSVIIDGDTFFSALGYSLAQWQKMTDSSLFIAIRTFPHLNALLTVLADWRIAAFTRRSVFRAMCSLAYKYNPKPENYYYAILGALTASPKELEWFATPQLSLAEKVMLLCEAKGDFSFIYCVAPREEQVDRRWRPVTTEPHEGMEVPPLLRPIFAWDCWGEAQRGKADEAGRLCLEATVTMYPDPEKGINEEARRDLAGWLNQPEAERVDQKALAGMIYESMQGVGFEGYPEPVVVSNGFVYMWREVNSIDITRLLISTQIRYPIGGPGLAQVGKGREGRYVPCVFVGAYCYARDGGETVVL